MVRTDRRTFLTEGWTDRQTDSMITICLPLGLNNWGVHVTSKTDWQTDRWKDGYDLDIDDLFSKRAVIKIKYSRTWYDFTDRSIPVLLLWILFVIYVSCLPCCLFCSLQPCGHLLVKGWHLGSLVCDICFLTLNFRKTSLNYSLLISL